MPNNITVTSTTGPGLSLTSQLFNNVTNLNFDYLAGVLTITWNDPLQGSKKTAVSLSSITTVTYTISSGIATVVAS